MIIFNKIIINADDFGFSYAVNRAILQSFQRSLVNSTSLIANMAGFEDAVGLLRTHPVLQGKIGVHLNITEGCPLSNDIRHIGRFCDAEGRFHYRRERHLFRMSRREENAIYEEMKTQLDRVIEAGIVPTHLDSHHHVHTEWAIAPIVCRLAREYHIGRMRIIRNMGRPSGYLKQIYKRLFNNWQFRQYEDFSNTDYFGDIEDMKYLMAIRPLEQKYIEVMVHPLFDGNGELVDFNRRHLQQQLAPILHAQYTISGMRRNERVAQTPYLVRI